MRKTKKTHLVRIDRDVERALRRLRKPGETWNQAVRRALGLK
jgi:hypothetical protein